MLPSWLVTDHRHTTHFLNPGLMVPGVTKKLLAKGELVQADTLDELAAKMGVEKNCLPIPLAALTNLPSMG